MMKELMSGRHAPCDSLLEGTGFELSVPQGMRARAMLSVDMIWFREI